MPEPRKEPNTEERREDPPLLLLPVCVCVPSVAGLLPPPNSLGRTKIASAATTSSRISLLPPPFPLLLFPVWLLFPLLPVWVLFPLLCWLPDPSRLPSRLLLFELWLLFC